MKRYRFLRDNFAECECEMEESNIGEWVRYEDVPERISDTPTLSAVPSEEKLASLADCINQELRESNGDEFQIKNIYEDYRPAIKKLVDLNRARGIAG